MRLRCRDVFRCLFSIISWAHCFCKQFLSYFSNVEPLYLSENNSDNSMKQTYNAAFKFRPILWLITRIKKKKVYNIIIQNLKSHLGGYFYAHIIYIKIPEMPRNGSGTSPRPPTVLWSLYSVLVYWSVSPAGQQRGPPSLSDQSVSIIHQTKINQSEWVGKKEEGRRKKGEWWRKYSHRTHLQNLDVGLVRVGHLHAVDLYEVEWRDFLLFCCLLQSPHHLVHRGRLSCARYARDIHTPVEHQNTWHAIKHHVSWGFFKQMSRCELGNVVHNTAGHTLQCHPWSCPPQSCKYPGTPALDMAETRGLKIHATYWGKKMTWGGKKQNKKQT